MKTLKSRELVERPERGELFLVEGQADGSYVLYEVTLARVGRWRRKWQAVRAAVHVNGDGLTEGRLE